MRRGMRQCSATATVATDIRHYAAAANGAVSGRAPTRANRMRRRRRSTACGMFSRASQTYGRHPLLFAFPISASSSAPCPTSRSTSPAVLSRETSAAAVASMRRVARGPIGPHRSSPPTSPTPHPPPLSPPTHCPSPLDAMMLDRDTLEFTDAPQRYRNAI
uniref:Uncharacterized protein n=1 Tax=Plectus sambesii TaxID=2011161 RepID=A0A914VE85_9BILA